MKEYIKRNKRIRKRGEVVEEIGGEEGRRRQKRFAGHFSLPR
jgi:hypothetical protein